MELLYHLLIVYFCYLDWVNHAIFPCSIDVVLISKFFNPEMNDKINHFVIVIIVAIVALVCDIMCIAPYHCNVTFMVPDVVVSLVIHSSHKELFGQSVPKTKSPKTSSFTVEIYRWEPFIVYSMKYDCIVLCFVVVQSLVLVDIRGVLALF